MKYKINAVLTLKSNETVKVTLTTHHDDPITVNAKLASIFRKEQYENLTKKDYSSERIPMSYEEFFKYLNGKQNMETAGRRHAWLNGKPPFAKQRRDR